MCFSATCFVSWTEHKHCAFDSLWPNLKLERDTRELVRHTDGRAQLILLTGFFLSPISLHLPFEQRWTSLRSLQRFSFSTGWLEYPLPHLHMNKMCFRQTWHVLFGSFQWYHAWHCNATLKCYLILKFCPFLKFDCTHFKPYCCNTSCIFWSTLTSEDHIHRFVFNRVFVQSASPRLPALAVSVNIIALELCGGE